MPDLVAKGFTRGAIFPALTAVISALLLGEHLGDLSVAQESAGNADAGSMQDWNFLSLCSFLHLLFLSSVCRFYRFLCSFSLRI